MPAYWRGSTNDRQLRIAQSSQQYDHVHGTPRPLEGQDAFPTGQSSFDSRRPAAYLARTYRYPVYDGNSGSAFLPEQPSGVIPAGQATLDTRRPIAFSKPPYRLASYDANSGQTLLPELLSQDAMATGEQSVALPPIAAARARDYTWSQELIPVLVGQDAVNTGEQRFDLPPIAAARLRDYSWEQELIPVLIGQDSMDVGAQFFELPPIAPQRARDYSFTPPVSLSLTAAPAGAQTTDSLPARAPARIRDYTWSQELIPVLIGQDAMTVGAQSTALSPIGSLRARDYSFVPPINLPVLTTVVQQIPYGQQVTDSLPARAAARLRDYTWSQELIPVLVSQDAMATGAQLSGNAPPAARRAVDYTHTQDLVPNLIGQDAMLVGEQSTALPPIGALRARDYTFAPPINLQTLTTVVQQIPYGAQVTDSLPPRAAARARDYTWSQDLIPNLIGQDAVNAGEQRFELAPSPAPLRARDYSIGEAFPLTLIGQDSMLVGEQVFNLPPIAALRARDYSFVPPANLPVLTTVVQPIPYGQQSTDNLPARAPARARDYTFTARFPLTLVGQDAMVVGEQTFALPTPARPRASTLSEPGVNLNIQITVVPLPAGKQSTDLTPKAAQRARDYSWLDNTKRHLIGKDAMTAGDSTHASENPPKAPQRARDYTWLQSFPLYVYQQVPTGQSSQETEGPPKGPLRLRDYTHLDLTKQNLIGQDSMIVGDTTYASELPPKAYARAQNLTVPDFVNMITLFVTPRRNPDWDISQPLSPWSSSTPGSRWVTGPPKE